jgi:hypothetical protein
MTSPQMYAGRKAVKYGSRYAARRVRRRARDTIHPGARGGIGARQAILFVGAGTALGLAIGWLLDPRRRGAHRNAAQHAAATMRHEARDAAAAAHRAANRAHGLAAEATSPLRDAMKEQPDDTSLARKVETEIFRDADAPKGSVNINAENGVVFLRGQVDSADTIAELVRQTEKVHGVRAVQSLLHLPGTPAPSKDEAQH